MQYGLSMQKKISFDKLFLPYVILSSSIASFFLLILIFPFISYSYFLPAKPTKKFSATESRFSTKSCTHRSVEYNTDRYFQFFIIAGVKRVK